MGIQQQLRDNAVLSVTYVGNSNYHQSQGRNINSLTENDPHRLGVCGSTCGYTGATLNANLYRPYQGWSTIAPMELSANSNYNSLQVALRVTAWKNLTLNSTYTWSHAFDIIDGGFSVTSTILSMPVGTMVPLVLTGGKSPSRASSTSSRYSGTQAARQ